MEQYEFENQQNTPTIKYGYFEQKVFDMAQMEHKKILQQQQRFSEML